MTNRLSWYQAGESMEDILVQAGNVGIYDGDSKQDRRLVLHHALVKNVEKHHRNIFSRGGKINVYVEQPPATLIGPVNSSTNNHLRLVFKGGGEDESRASHATQQAPQRAVGIAGIERKLAENHMRTHESISAAFEDMSRLMESAREMVTLSKAIAEKLRSRKGEITDDETIAFKSYLLSLGVSDPVTKSAYGGGSVYFEKLAEELTTVLVPALKECGGMMTLPEVYCRINRARGLELLSPEDVLNGANALSKIGGALEMARFPSGVMVVQLKESSVESTIDDTTEIVSTHGALTATQLSIEKSITVVLAKERLLAAELAGKLCRDDSLEGLSFYPNKFLQAV